MTPPESTAVAEREASTFLETAEAEIQAVEALTITNDAEATAAADLLRKITSLRSDCEGQRLGWTKPLNATVKKLNAMFRPPLMKLDDLKDRLKRVLGAYQTQKRLEHEAAEAKRIKLEREAEQKRLEAERLEQARLQAAERLRVHNEGVEQTFDAGDHVDACEIVIGADGVKRIECRCPPVDDDDLLDMMGEDEIPEPDPEPVAEPGLSLQDRIAEQKALDDAEAASAEAATAIVPTDKASSYTGGKVTSRKRWTHEITDASLVPRDYLVVDDKLIRVAMRAGVRDIPGVRIFQKDEVY